jgi:methylmalonyl-CoA/ethylmalonyl-CoA epimerase
MSSTTSNPAPGQPALDRVTVHHYGYAVLDLEQSIHRAVEILGTGPFLLIDNVPLEGVTSRGEPARFSHSTAFAQWGDVRIELSQIHVCEPERVREAFAVNGPQVNHVAWAVEDLDDASQKLELGGAPAFLSASLGEISFVFHDTRSQFGHHIEVHRNSPDFNGFFEQVRAASIDWDGSDPIRAPSF